MKTECIAFVMLVAVSGLTQVVSVKAAETKDAGGPSLQERATEPISIFTQLQLQNVFIPGTLVTPALTADKPHGLPEPTTAGMRLSGKSRLRLRQIGAHA